MPIYFTLISFKKNLPVIIITPYKIYGFYLLICSFQKEFEVADQIAYEYSRVETVEEIWGRGGKNQENKTERIRLVNKHVPQRIEYLLGYHFCPRLSRGWLLAFNVS